MTEQIPAFPGYKDLEVWREGAITSSYRAVQESIGRAVLIKSLSPSVLPSSPFAQALDREARVLARLHHDCFQQIFEFRKTDDRMWLVLEGLDGWTLQEVLGRVPQLAPEVAAAIALQVTQGLEHLHEHEIVHADLQPMHVLLTPSGSVRILGLAAACVPDAPEIPELLEGDQGVAAPHYKAPEQVLGERPTPAADVYATGVVLYEMLSGRRPFDAPEARTLSQMIRNDSPPSLHESGVSVPGTVERIVRRCLEKLPVDRFYSVRELRTALAEYLAGTGASYRSLTREALLAGGFIGGGGAEPRATVAPPPPRRSDFGIGVGFYLACLALVVVGGAAIQLWFPKDVRSAPQAQALELLPHGAAFVRVVAHPWAHVVVDGQRVETTPFARPIPLSPGTHYVQLEHPAAPTVQRTLHLAAGENILLDIKMDVPAAPAPPASAPKPRVDAGPPTP